MSVHGKYKDESQDARRKDEHNTVHSHDKKLKDNDKSNGNAAKHSQSKNNKK
jgi:hypothetical protein